MVASNNSVHGFLALGSLNLKGPIGASAYGIPEIKIVVLAVGFCYIIKV